jgi:uncharacterized membrane protein
MAHGIGLLMVVLFAYLYFGPYRSLGAALAASDVPGAAAAMKRIRPVMVTNLSLGVLITLVGVAGPGFG